MRWLILIILLAACTVNQDATPVLIQELPTRVILPSNTPTITPRPSHTPTRTPTSTATLESTETPTSPPMTTVVIAIEPIPQGYAIPPHAVTLFSLPPESVPVDAVLSLNDVINHVARVDIGCFEPISAETLALREVGSGYVELPQQCPPLAEMAIEMGSVVVATRWIPPGEIISPSMVMLRDYPLALISPDAITSLSDAIGKQTDVDILREQPIRVYHLNDAP